MISMRQENYFRLKSAHLQRYEQVQEVNQSDDKYKLQLPALSESKLQPAVPLSEYIKNWRLRPGLKKAQTAME